MPLTPWHRRAHDRLESVLRADECVELLIPARYLGQRALVAVSTHTLCVVPLDPSAGRGVQSSHGAIVAVEVRRGALWSPVICTTRATMFQFAIRLWHWRALQKALAATRANHAMRWSRPADPERR